MKKGLVSGPFAYATVASIRRCRTQKREVKITPRFGSGAGADADQNSGCDERRVRVPLPAPCDADQAKQAGDEQPDRSGNRNGDVGARPGSERKHHVGDEGARSHTRQREREGHRLICERIMRTVSSDGGTGVGIGTGRIRQRPVKKV